jgi:hypothetical protein
VNVLVTVKVIEFVGVRLGVGVRVKVMVIAGVYVRVGVLVLEGQYKVKSTEVFEAPDVQVTLE